VVGELGSRVLLLPPRPGRALFDGPAEGTHDELLVASGLAHRHRHQHQGKDHEHFHVHDGD
jgi:cobalt/nickel transport system ATP-binding protein